MAHAAVNVQAETARRRVDFATHPGRYRHWTLSIRPIATLLMNVDEEGGLRPGYKLKLNSYDLGVDIELHDALQRIRFEHPEVRCVVLTSAKERIFCSGANIFMLGLSSHAWKVNFCKFTNETRNGIEDSSRHSGLKFLAACNGTTAGGGYELALACDEILLVDDRSAAVSLPEVPLLGSARHRWPDPVDRQAQSAPGPGRHVLHTDRRCACASCQGMATDRRSRQAAAVCCDRPATVRTSWPHPAIDRPKRRESSSRRSRGGSMSPAITIRLLMCGRCGTPDRDVDGPCAARTAAGMRSKAILRRGALVAVEHGARARRRHPDVAQ